MLILSTSHFFSLPYFFSIKVQDSLKSQGETPTSKVEGGKGLKKPNITKIAMMSHMVLGPFCLSLDFCIHTALQCKQEKQAKAIYKPLQISSPNIPENPRGRPIAKISSNTKQKQENKNRNHKSPESDHCHSVKLSKYAILTHTHSSNEQFQSNSGS